MMSADVIFPRRPPGQNSLDGLVEGESVEHALHEVGDDARLGSFKVAFEGIGLESIHTERLVEYEKKLAESGKLP